jgi:chromosomal replication initiator protein
VNAELDHIWTQVQDELARAVDESAYRLWLHPLRACELREGRLVVEAPPQACTWICQRFGRLLQASATLVIGADTFVELLPSGGGGGAGKTRVVGPPRHAAHQPGQPGGASRPRPGARGERPAGGGAPVDVLGNPKLTFDQFVIGDCNRLAHAAALTVAEMPGHAYNPLFICGPPGVGKTHLLCAIAQLVLAHSPGLTVRCTTGEAFTNEFLGALAGGATELFKSHFRDVDVLLLDDVQFLERKTRTEEEFFHTFNALYDGGRQIILSSDRPPPDLQGLEDRLRERFQAGLVADIRPPAPATRLGVLRKRVQQDGIAMSDERVLSLLAERVTHNIRALEGALIRVVAYSSLTGRPLTIELAAQVLDGLYPQRTAAHSIAGYTVADIQAAACAFFHVSLEELLSARRSARIAWPRQVAMYLTRELTSESLPAIGRQFGGRDHTTVLHAWRRTSARLAADPERREAVDKLRCELAGETAAQASSHDRFA